jgi:lipopolysaccharide/colanic/teichoic acid biosynthesis glycosyltransferase
LALPGLTGLAQVSGRKDVPWPERLRLDAEYVRNQSLGLDLAIMFRTLRVVVSSKGNHNASIPGNEDA